MDGETRFGCQDQVRHIRSRLFVENIDIGDIAVRLADEVFDHDAPVDLGQRLPSAVGQLVQGEDATKNTDVTDITKSGLVDVRASLDRDYNRPRASKGPSKRLNG